MDYTEAEAEAKAAKVPCPAGWKEHDLILLFRFSLLDPFEKGVDGLPE